MLRPISLIAAVGFAVVTVWVAGYRPHERVERQYRTILLVVFGASALSYGGVGLGYGTLVVDGDPVLWLHYLEWLVGTPAYVAGLFLLTGDRLTVRRAVALDLLMVTAGAAAALSAGVVSLALFGVSTSALVGLFVLLVTADPVPGWRADLYGTLRRLFLALGPGYPVVWLVGSEGVGLVGVAATNRAFLLLDAAVKGGLLVVLVRHGPLAADD